ncbi:MULTISPECIES: hypothetical protein [unclassified Acinetobacter]|nr:MULTISPECIES: hypothetical protein [unclassified Acinetobacter]
MERQKQVLEMYCARHCCK